MGVENENKVAVVTDSSCSFSQEDLLARGLNISVLPLHINFTINGETQSYADGNLTPDEFRNKLQQSPALPTTDGSVQGSALEIYPHLAEKTNQIISIHITSKLSAAYSSARTAADKVMEAKPGLLINVVDSKRISLAMFFLVELAAKMAAQQASLEEINQGVIDAIPNTGFVFGLSTYENLVKSGRVSQTKAWLATKIRTYPLLGMLGDSGELDKISLVRTVGKMPSTLKNTIVEACGSKEIARLAVLHTNNLSMATDLQGMLQEIYPGEILIKDVTASAIGIYAGDGGLGVAFMTN
ncbi:MAG: DegV family protein [Candidatus Beckwithbacteria bacterium]